MEVIVHFYWIFWCQKNVPVSLLVLCACFNWHLARVA